MIVRSIVLAYASLGGVASYGKIKPPYAITKTYEVPFRHTEREIE